MRFATYSGRLIDIENFTVDDVYLEDISHSLAKLQRFNGNLPINISYTVGEHSINLTMIIIKLFGIRAAVIYALLHDATEAYLSDLLSPVKNILTDYKNLENYINNIIMKRFEIELSEDKRDIIKNKDKRIMLDEVETIMPDKYVLYQQETGLEKLGCHIMYNNHPATVKQCFLTMAKNLGIK